VIASDPNIAKVELIANTGQCFQKRGTTNSRERDGVMQRGEQ